MNYIEGVILMKKKAVAFTGHRPESLPFGRDMHSGRYDDFELIDPNTLEKIHIPAKE